MQLLVQTPKTWKKRAQKLLIIGHQLFFYVLARQNFVAFSEYMNFTWCEQKIDM